MGMIMFLPFTCLTEGCSFSQLNMVGMEGPKISASISPTFAPAFAKETARLEVMVLLPTPPFPEAMAIIFFTPGKIGALSRSDVTDDVMLIVNGKVLPITLRTAFSQSFRIISFKGQAGVVRTTVNETPDSATSTDFIMFRLTKSLLISGSITVESASIISF